jgi:hypothetical protein
MAMNERRRNATIVSSVTMVVIAIGWFWRRYR